MESRDIHASGLPPAKYVEFIVRIGVTSIRIIVASTVQAGGGGCIATP